MTQINQLSATDTVSAGDLVPVSLGGDARSASMSALLAYMQANLTALSGNLATQYASPLTGDTVSVTGNGNIWLILTPAATIAALTVVLPGNPVDKQELTISSAQTITALTLTGNTAVGAPSTTGADAQFRLRFEGVTRQWYRVA